MRVTADTNFLVSATQWDYSVAHKLLRKFLGKGVEIFTTEAILEEFSEVLKRDFKYTSEETENIMEKVLLFATLVVPLRKIDVIKEDPEDNKILECAVESSSRYIISYDRHLLDIGEYEGIKIIKPEEAIALVD